MWECWLEAECEIVDWKQNVRSLTGSRMWDRWLEAECENVDSKQNVRLLTGSIWRMIRPNEKPFCGHRSMQRMSLPSNGFVIAAIWKWINLQWMFWLSFGIHPTSHKACNWCYLSPELVPHLSNLLTYCKSFYFLNFIISLLFQVPLVVVFIIMSGYLIIDLFTLRDS
jgi:hypothetical protein